MINSNETLRELEILLEDLTNEENPTEWCPEFTYDWFYSEPEEDYDKNDILIKSYDYETYVKDDTFFIEITIWSWRGM